MIENGIKFDIGGHKKYYDYLKNKKNSILENNKKLIDIPQYSILVGDEIKTDYYFNIFKYLYYEKTNNTNIARYPDVIAEIKDKFSKDKNKIF